MTRSYGFARTMARALGEIALERWQAVRARRRKLEPRIERGWRYSMVRAFTTVVQLDLQVATVTADVLSGRPAVYTPFSAYDEVAHHSGVERPETLAVLRRVDRAIARIAAAVVHAPRPYRLVVLSDHGQSQGATFLQRYGETLEQVVRRAAGLDAGAPHVEQAAGSDEALGVLAAGLTELGNRSGAVGHTARAVAKRRMADDGTPLRQAEREKRSGSTADLPEVVVTASGTWEPCPSRDGLDA